MDMKKKTASNPVPLLNHLPAIANIAPGRKVNFRLWIPIKINAGNPGSIALSGSWLRNESKQPGFTSQDGVFQIPEAWSSSRR